MPNDFLPSLSEDGWVNTTSKMVDYMMSHFLLSEYSRDPLYRGNITSLPYILQSSNGNVEDAIANARTALQTYFSRYFDNVEVQVVEQPNDEQPGLAQIKIYIQFTDKNGVTDSVGRLILIAGTIVQSILDLDTEPTS
jgi:hypothetical protein